MSNLKCRSEPSQPYAVAGQDRGEDRDSAISCKELAMDTEFARAGDITLMIIDEQHTMRCHVDAVHDRLKVSGLRFGKPQLIGSQAAILCENTKAIKKFPISIKSIPFINSDLGTGMSAV